MIDTIGTGKHRFSMEMRFAPMIDLQGSIIDERIGGRHVIKAGDTLLVSNQSSDELEPTQIIGFENGYPLYSNIGQRYTLIRDNKLKDSDFDAIGMIEELIDGTFVESTVGYIRNVELFMFANDDGPYYAIEPRFNQIGHFEALHIYPSGKRKGGVNDAGRYFLNTILDYKKAHNLERRDQFIDATWDDVDAILQLLTLRAEDVKEYSLTSAEHILRNIIPMVEMQIKILKAANFPPHLFFDSGFTIDTGQIVNQGRAITQFKGVVTTQDTPFTPHEERGYGKLSYSTLRGTVWKLSPLPQFADIPTSQVGLRNREFHEEEGALASGSLVLTPLENGTLDPIFAQAIVMNGVDVEQISLMDARMQFLLPGLKKADKESE